MATAKPAGDSDTADLVNILNLFKGSSSSSTTSSNISKGGMDAIVQQILGSANGLAQVSSGQKIAGLYNSTTNQQLTNDLISRTAGELAKQQAGTTTTTKNKAPLGLDSILGLLVAGGAKSLLGPTFSGLGKKLGVDQYGQKIADALGVSGPTAADNINANAPSPDSGAIDLFNGTGVTDALTSYGSTIADDIGTNVASGAAGTVADDGDDLAGLLFG